MSKQHSQTDTHLTPHKYTEVKGMSVVEQTQLAVDYYRFNRKEYLQNVKQEYLHRVGQQRRVQENRDSEETPVQESKRRKKRKKKEIRHQQTIQVRRIDRIRRVDYRENSHTPEKIDKKKNNHEERVLFRHCLKENENVFDQLQPEGTYEIKSVHQCILDLQKTTDNYLDYQWRHRKRRSIDLQQLFTFLKTTKYGLNCQRYFHYLCTYNFQLYKQTDNYLRCQEFNSDRVEERQTRTRSRMTQILVEELLL